ncbi:flagellar hook-associated protein FlgK [Anaerobaca lacustris]|uniref:Flagellar hook-associated protein 1 n=1 Tax=Anaerobaca lacustris TaxID=3044600 RepID=A0AAW6TV50_9BACT|nr:flagellar hook-associated protein FlgK [Sedimentisphaerales bacterium M17dextr]
MQNYVIGLSGLNAAYAALDVVGNNIANAATEGYHRQRVDFVPAGTIRSGTVEVGGGVQVAGVVQMVDRLLEGELLRQQSSYGEISQELTTLTSVETIFGEFMEEGGLNATIDAFFDAVRGLAAHPAESVWRNETISLAEVLASEFRRMGTSLTKMEEAIVTEAQNAAESINTLVKQIAELNTKIQSVEITGGHANNLRDHRDRLVSQLGALVGIEVVSRDYGVVDISIGGLPAVTGAVSLEISATLQDGRYLNISAAGTTGSSLNIRGGRLGGLLALKNDWLPGLRGELDTLAKGIINQVNACHVQGLGLDGSFTQLIGEGLPAEDLASVEPAIVDGTFYIRLTNTDTGQIERHAIDVDVTGATPDTLASIAAKIGAIDGLNASVGSSRLHIISDLGYAFDFIPALLPEPNTSNLTAAQPPAISVSGIYNGQANQRLTFTTVGTGTVGNGSLRLDIRDEAGDMVATLNIGSGYAAGDVIEMRNGVKIAVGPGDLNEADTFTVDVFGTTDTSGFLAAAGLNTFFTGASASEMRLRADVAENPNRIATAAGADLSDNTIASRLAHVKDEPIDSLDGLTGNEYYQRIVARVGQEVALKQSRQDNIEALITNLEKRQSEISGVNINDEAAQLLLFEKTFQAVAKYLNSLQMTMKMLMDIV